MEMIVAGKPHYEQIAAIVLEGHVEHVEALPNIFLTCEDAMPRVYFEELVESPTSDVLIVMELGEVLGFAVISLENTPLYDSLVARTYAYIHDFGVKASAQRRGIGRKLFTFCRQWASERQAKTIELNVFAFNERAINFYEQLGMTEVSKKYTISL